MKNTYSNGRIMPCYTFNTITMSKTTINTGNEQAGTKILHCSCKHEFQDSRYGEQQRVHNSKASAKTGGGTKWRCTVCGNEK